MAIQAKPLMSNHEGPPLWFQIDPGKSCEIALELSDSESGSPIDLAGHVPRFRVYSQVVDRLIAVEITDPERCKFDPKGIWTLQLTAEETASLPRGGMRFTLEHLTEEGNYEFVLQGGVSRCQTETRRDAGQHSKPVKWKRSWTAIHSRYNRAEASSD
ncbi:hypothetical protein Poly51_21250 [Rubripirellula tenax]|uniref:Uncharacterized protein n=2 Tax=Rubripirellula tenax TaxID=2528015 RepID=A0A5C6FF31_9BACT|nr:hypothetical protein Poly51_21250 [Rubripirellula tenax]